MHVAATHLHGIDLARLLLRSGANSNAKNDEGWTPLHMTALSGNSQLAELLLVSNAQPNLKAKNGWTPFFTALSRGQREVMRILHHQQPRFVVIKTHEVKADTWVWARTDRDLSSAPCQCCQTLLKHRAADQIERHVRSFSVSRFASAFCQLS